MTYQWTSRRFSRTSFSDSVGHKRLAFESLERRLVLDSTAVFNEIMYNPTDSNEGGEWVELYNQMAVDMDISNWSLEGGIDFTFREGTVVPGHGFVIVASDPVAFESLTGLTDAEGPFLGQLANGGEELRLLNNSGRIMNRVDYRDSGDWPVGADGSGATLTKLNDRANSELSANWTASTQIGGTPAAANFSTSDNLLQLVKDGDPTRVLVPSQASHLAANWNTTSFDDQSAANWFHAQLGVGFDSDGSSTVAPLIDAGGNIQSQMLGVNASAFTRTPFQIDDPTSLDQLTLAIDYNDGYVAYINGVEVGRNNAPEETLTFNTEAAGISQTLTNEYASTLPTGSGSTNITTTHSSSIGSPVYGSENLVDGNFAGESPGVGEIGGELQASGFYGHTTDPDPHMWITSHTIPVNQQYVSFSFNDGPHTFRSMRVWNYNEITPTNGNIHWNRGVKDMWVWYSNNSTLPNITPGVGDANPGAGWTRFHGTGAGGRVTLHKASAAGWYDGETVLLDDFSARHVLLMIDANHGDPTYVGLSEVQFFQNSTGTPIAPGTGQDVIDLRSQFNSLVAGTNVLAIQGLNFSENDTDFLTRPQLSGHLKESVVLGPKLVINEVAPGDGSPFWWVEIANLGGTDVNLNGHALVATGTSGGQFTFGTELLPAGSFRNITSAELGFSAIDGNKLFLYKTNQTELVDAQLVDSVVRGRSVQHNQRWLFPNATTPGAMNTFDFEDAIVINEIMYHHQPDTGPPFVKIPEEWVELYNRNSSGSIDLTGWSIDGIDYDFPAGTLLAAGQYLVVSNNASQLAKKFPAAAGQIIGDFSGRLSNKSEAIRLVDRQENPADEVHYFDGGRWPEFADGGGSSLELRNPNADNSKPESWAASDESSKSNWQTFTIRQTASADTGPIKWRELDVGLLDAGQILIDDVSVLKNPGGAAQQLIQNGSFESDVIGGEAAKWRFVGNHHGTVIVDPTDPSNQVVKLVATGPTSSLHNHGETTFIGNAPVINGVEYEISFRAKWLRGSNQFNTRFYVTRVGETSLVDVAHDNGTPGAINSSWETNTGPTYTDFGHHPVLPANQQDTTVTVIADDPDGVAAMMLRWGIDGGSLNNTTMTSLGNGFYTGTIPGQPSSTIIQFYVEGQDTLGAISTFPADGAESRALYVVDDGQTTSQPIDSIRIVMLTEEHDELFVASNLMNNELAGATIIHNGDEVFYDIGVRRKGSISGRQFPDSSVSYKIRFHPDQQFRGVHETIALDGSGSREILLTHAINHAGNGPSLYHDVAHMIAPRNPNPHVILQLARYDDVFLDEQFINGSDGTDFEFETIMYESRTVDGNPESLKTPIPLVGGIGTDLKDLGDSKENYRWNFQIKNNRARDDYSKIIELGKAFDLNGEELENAVQPLMDVDQWMRSFAMISLGGCPDVYTVRLPHNVRLYVRPDDQKVLVFPWDMDSAFSSGAGAPLFGTGWNLSKVIDLPANTRRYFGHLLDMVDTTFNENYMNSWGSHYETLFNHNFSQHVSFIQSRSASVTSQIQSQAPQVAFAITSSNPLDAGTAQTASIMGTGWVDIDHIRLAGSNQPLEVTWSKGNGSRYANTWNVTVPVDVSTTSLTFEAYGYQGNLIGTDSIDVSSLATNDIVGSLRISEINYHPFAPMAAEITAGFDDDDDFEFLELVNVGSSSISLAGSALTDGVSFVFPNESTPVETYFLTPGSTARTLIPTQTSELTFQDLAWNQADFDDVLAPGWFSTSNGVGFDTAGDSDVYSLMGPNGDIASAMHNVNASGFARFPFQIMNPAGLNRLNLELDYNDGYIAYLNGVEIARQHAPAGNPTFDATAVGSTEFLINQYNSSLPNGGGSTNITTTYSSALAPPTYDADKIVDGNFAGQSPGQGQVGGELQASGFYGHTTDPDPHMWITSSSSPINQQYASFSFHDKSQSLDSMRIWNYNEITPPTGAIQTNRGVRDMWVWYSNDLTLPAITPGPATSHPGAGWTLFQGPDTGGRIRLGKASASGTYDGETVDLENLTARHVLFMIDSNHGDNYYVGLSEVQFRRGDDESLIAPGTGHDTIDLMPYLGSLVAGKNVLAMQGLNITADDSDFLLRPILNGQQLATNQLLAPGQRTLLVRNRDAFQTRYGGALNIAGQYSGKLDNGGERLRLETIAGETILDFTYGDNRPWPERADGAGGTLVAVDTTGTSADQYGKHYHWRGSTLFGGSPGTDSSTSVGVVINEVLAHTDPPVTQSDSIELYNMTEAAIEITGWHLSDSLNNLQKYTIPEKVIPAGGYLVLDESNFNPNPGMDSSFALSGAHGDDIWMTLPNEFGKVGSFVDDVHFSASPNGESFARVPNGSGHLAPMQSLTLGTENGKVRVGPLVISELNYNPAQPSAAALALDPTITADNLEFVELYNPTGIPIDLTEWRIRGAISYDFTTGTLLDVDGVLVITSFNPDDPGNSARLAAFRAHYDMDSHVKLAGGYQMQLNDSFERVELQRPDTPPLDEPTVTPRLQEDEIIYDDLPPWPISADGAGNTLHRTNPRDWGSHASSWTGGPPGPGKIDRRGDTDLDGDVDTGDLTTAIINFTSAGALGKTWSQGDTDGDGDVDTTDLTTAIINFTGAQATQSVLASKGFASVEIAKPSQSGPWQATISDRDRIFTNGYQGSERIGNNMTMGNPTVNDNRMPAAKRLFYRRASSSDMPSTTSLQNLDQVFESLALPPPA